MMSNTFQMKSFRIF